MRSVNERYCLYSVDRQGQIYRGEIHHSQWPLQPASATISRETLAEAAGIRLPHTSPLLSYSERLDVVIWPIRRI